MSNCLGKNRNVVQRSQGYGCVAQRAGRGLPLGCTSALREDNKTAVSTPFKHSLQQAACAALLSTALVLGPIDEATAARTGGRLGASRTTFMMRKRAMHDVSLGSSRRLANPARYKVPMSLRLRALHPMVSVPDPVIGGHVALSARPPLLIGDILAYPDLAAGIDLEALPLWASFLGLIAANVAGLALTIAILRNIQDTSEPLSVVKVQVAMLERRPQLQFKLRQLSSMIQVGQQGAWLILEEAILQLLQRQNRIAYAAVSCEQVNSKKRAYTIFGEIAEAEGAKANQEETVVRHIGETTDEDVDDEDKKNAARSGLFGGFMGGLGLSKLPAGKELTVVTLILATRGKLNITEKVTNWAGLRSALKQLTGLSSDRIMAVELLWTPRNESDYLTPQQLEADYPDMAPLMQLGGAVGEPSL